MLNISVADDAAYPRVREFYYSLIDAMKDAEYKPGWEKDIYPTQEFLLDSIRRGELYIGELEDGSIASCMVVNHSYNDGYHSVTWTVDADDTQLLVIHALGVHPLYAGKGFAKQMVQKVIDVAREKNIKTIRLDVLGGNLPAEKAYTSMGFVYRGATKMFYEDTGWTEFRLFEYVV